MFLATRCLGREALWEKQRAQAVALKMLVEMPRTLIAACLLEDERVPRKPVRNDVLFGKRAVCVSAIYATPDRFEKLRLLLQSVDVGNFHEEAPL